MAYLKNLNRQINRLRTNPLSYNGFKSTSDKKAADIFFRGPEEWVSKKLPPELKKFCRLSTIQVENQQKLGNL